MIVLGTDGSIQRRELTGAAGLLPQLRKEVGGYIEVVPYFSTYLDEGEQKPCIALCNEDGKLNGLAPNALATALWHAQLRQEPPALGMPMAMGQLDVLVGNVIVIIGDDEFMEEF